MVIRIEVELTVKKKRTEKEKKRAKESIDHKVQ
jgi:hypothetical protein